MLLKYVHMGKKFQGTLKLSMSFILNHFFITVTFSTQVASASLRFIVVQTQQIPIVYLHKETHKVMT